MASRGKYQAMKIIAIIYLVLSIPVLLIGIGLVLFALLTTIIAAVTGKWAAVLLSLPFLASSLGFFLVGAGLLAVKEFIFLAISVEKAVNETAGLLKSNPQPLSSPTKKRTLPLGEPTEIDDYDAVFDDEEIEEEDSNGDLFEDEIDPDELNFDEPEEIEEEEEIPTPEPVEVEKPKTVSLTCLKCGKKANAPIAALGKKVRCSGCSSTFVAKK